jgi:5,10-methylenetetrahydrofolate reductase
VDRKNLETKLAERKFVVTAEIAPPKGVECSKVLEEVDALAPYVDAINSTEVQRSIMRMGSLAMSRLVMERGVEPIMQMTCGHKNRIALQSELLSAGALGIRNVLVLGGDPPAVGDHPDAKAVYDLDAVTLMEAAKKLKGGKDLAGNDLAGAPDLYLGGALNPGASDVEVELQKMEKKIESGCQFFQTQAIYDLDSFEKFMKRAGSFQLPVLAGIIPLKSAKMANFLNKIPGIHVPDALIHRIDEAKDKEQAASEIAAGLVRGARDLCAGVHLMTLGWFHLIGPILELAGVAAQKGRKVAS